MERPTVYFSNRLEELGLSLGHQLFTPSADPFEKRIVLLPSHTLKGYLSSLFASNSCWNICAGISFKSLLEGTIDQCQEKFFFPSKLALFFAIEQELLQIEQEDDEIFLELKHYLSEKESSEQKILWICEELAQVFYNYSMYEPSCLKLWLKNSGWKQEVWKRIFSKEPLWNCLAEEISQAVFSKTSIHLFGFSHIPSHLYQFFCRMGATFYFLSPSCCFWEDLCSDKERLFLEKKMEGKKVRLQVRDQMIFLLKQTHSLLANWGKVGRTLLRRFGDSEVYLEELYKDPIEECSCLLTHLQASLLQLEGGEIREKTELFLEDRSFICLSAPSKLREVEALFETIQEYLSLDEEIEPKDILVLCPDLEGYFPFIQMVFGLKSGKIDYSVHGLPRLATSEKFQALSLFFSLSERRFDRESILQWISFPSVMRKFEWKEEDVKLFEEWFEKANILWGLDPEHKKNCLDRTWPQDAFALPLPLQGTWEEGLNRLFHGLAIDPDSLNEIVFPLPLPMINWTDAEKLGEFAHLLYCLKEDLKPIYQKEKKLFKEWVLLVQSWLSFYFEKSSVEEGLFKDLERLKVQLEQRLTFPISFTSFKKTIEEHFQEKKESFQSSHLNAVKFLSAELGSCYPSKVICLLGCDEGSFPRRNPPSCLEDFEKQKQLPSQAEQDRYFLLEMILHARKALVISYQKIGKEDQKEQGPSLLVKELMNHLDQVYVFKDSEKKPSEIVTRHHPAIPFHQSYFQKESSFRSFSESSFELACSYYSIEKEELPSFFCRKKEETKPCLKEAIRLVEIKKMQDFAKDPAYFYLKEKLGIFFEFENSQETEFFLSPLVRFQIKQDALKKKLSQASIKAQAKGQFPLGSLGRIAIEDMEEDLQEWEESLSFFGIKQEDLFSIEFLEGVKKIEKEGQKVISPLLEVEIEEIGVVLIQGKLLHCSSKGLIWFGKTDKQHLPQMFPSILLFMCLAEKEGWEKQCLLLESGKILSLSVQDPLLHLKLYLKLYFRSLEEPCLVRPEWSLDFLTKTPLEIQKKQSSFFQSKKWIPTFDEWMLKRDPLLNIELLQQEWKKEWEEVFSPFLDQEKK